MSTEALKGFPIDVRPSNKRKHLSPDVKKKLFGLAAAIGVVASGVLAIKEFTNSQIIYPDAKDPNEGNAYFFGLTMDIPLRDGGACSYNAKIASKDVGRGVVLIDTREKTLSWFFGETNNCQPTILTTIPLVK